MRLVTLALVTTLGCSTPLGHSRIVPPPMKSPRAPRVVDANEANAALTALLPVAVFAVGAVVVGGTYLAIGGNAP